VSFAGTALAARSSAPDTSGMRLIVSKHTFAVKDRIKQAGGIWDSSAKGWRVPEGFDDSFIPQDKASATSIPKRAPARCGFCKEVGHSSDRCSYECIHCQLKGAHLSEKCPTTNVKWKRMLKSKTIDCECSSNEVCWFCENLCCVKAELKALSGGPDLSGPTISSCPEHGDTVYNL
jgi:hypothetical protein